MAEAYNETWQDSEEVENIKNFLEKNKSVGNHFKRGFNDKSIDINLTPSEFTNKQDKDHIFVMHEMHRKSISQVLFNFWVHEELFWEKLDW